jgi:hypothetical protein
LVVHLSRHSPSPLMSLMQWSTQALAMFFS